MAVAFAIEHPAVTSAIIGPRTMEHLESLLGTGDIVLDPSVLDGDRCGVPAGYFDEPAGP